jgi:hypothetical protein
MNTYEIGNAIAIGLAVVLNAVAMFSWINKTNIKKVSDENETEVTPQRWTFFVWGIIYGFLILFSVYALVYLDILARQLTVWVMLLMAFNIFWVILNSYF